MLRFPLCSVVVRTQLQTQGPGIISRDHGNQRPLTIAYSLHKKTAIHTPIDGVMRVYIAMYIVFMRNDSMYVVRTASHQRL